MDKRLRLYITGFIFSLLLQLIFFAFPFTGIVVWLIFLGLTFRFVFSSDKLPDEKYLSDPKVHYYHKSRMNSYGYIMAVSLILISLMFFLLGNFAYSFPGVSSLICWFILIVVSFYATKYQSKSELKGMAVDFINLNTDSRFSYRSISLIVDTLINTNPENYVEKLSSIDFVERLTTEDLIYISEMFLFYINKISEDELVSGEVESINEQSNG